MGYTPLLDLEMASSIEIVTCQAQDRPECEEHRCEVSRLSGDRRDRRQAVDDHAPRLIYDGKNRKAHTHSERELKSAVANVLALVQDDGDEEEEVAGR